MESLRIAYKGPGLDDGSMEIEDLAPALLNLGHLLQNANQMVSGGGPHDLSVRVKSTGKGSFCVDIDLGLLATAKSLFNSDNLSAAAAIITAILGGKGLVGLIRWLAGRSLDSAEITTLENNNVKIEMNDKSNMTVNKNVINLYNSPGVPSSVAGVVKPLARDGIDSIEFDHKKNKIETISKSELGLFEEFASADRQVNKSERVIDLEVISVSFEGNYKWRLSDGNARFTASMEDKTFLADVQDTGHISFKKGTVLRVNLQSVTSHTEKGLKTQYAVKRVVEVLPQPKR